MEIELNASRILSMPHAAVPQRARGAAAPGDEAEFSGAEALSKAMAQLPDHRPEVVQRAKEIVGSVKYPPGDTLNRIANLLAMKLDYASE